MTHDWPTLSADMSNQEKAAHLALAWWKLTCWVWRDIWNLLTEVGR